MVMNAADELQGSSGAVFIIYANDNMSPVCEISVITSLIKFASVLAVHNISLTNFFSQIDRRGSSTSSSSPSSLTTYYTDWMIVVHNKSQIFLFVRFLPAVETVALGRRTRRETKVETLSRYDQLSVHTTKPHKIRFG
jgi:hypothetical protein